MTDFEPMTGADVTEARERLGVMWGFGRSLRANELGRALRMGGKVPGESIRDYETGKTPVSGPVSVAIDMMLEGTLPPDSIALIKTRPSRMRQG